MFDVFWKYNFVPPDAGGRGRGPPAGQGAFERPPLHGTAPRRHQAQPGP